MTLRCLAGAVFAAVAAFCPSAQSETLAKHHMIAAANPYAAAAGLAMLRQGGSAVDAAIAAQMVLTLVEPESSGLGGGAFMLLWDPAKKKVTSFDGRETAPASATPVMFLDTSGQPRAHMDAIPGGFRSACRASSPCWNWRTSVTANCPGQNCSLPPLHLPKRACR